MVLNMIAGYLRLEGLISSILILSKAFLREVACLDLDAFAENRRINSCNSFTLSSVFLF
ncbi:hypothetical protein D3C87_1825690 [compost metagenome]